MTSTRRASMILPIHSDPGFEAKAATIANVAGRLGWTITIPEYSAAAPVFDAGRARAALDGVSLVIADLSRQRPSCYFELGFAEAVGARIRLIAEAGTELHQTSHRDRVIFYDGPSDLARALTQVLRDESGD